MKKVLSVIAIVALLTACNGHSKQDNAVIINQQKTIDSMNAVAATQRAVDSVKAINIQSEKKNPQNTPVVTTTKHKKKGWTGAEKGAVIGAGAGILTGVLVDKKHRGTGALIGGVSGAAVGAGTGAIIDSKKK